MPIPPAPGLVCPSCGHAKCPALRTRRYPGKAVRIRRCRNCGHHFRTAERVEATSVTVRPRSKPPPPGVGRKVGGPGT